MPNFWSVTPNWNQPSLAEMGVPGHLLKFVRTFPARGPEVRIESTDDVSIDDLQLLANLGLSRLLIKPNGSFDLHAIADALTCFPSLLLGQNAPVDPNQSSFVGIQELESLDGLIELEAEVRVVGEANLANLPKLRRVRCSGTFALSAAQNPHVEELRVNVGQLDRSFRIDAPLMRLVISGGKGMSVLPPMKSPSTLKSLIVDDARVFDASCLRDFSSLETIEFFACAKLARIETLLTLQSLTEIVFEGVKEMPGFEVLADLAAPKFEVESNWVFDDDFQERVRARPGWRFTQFKSRRPKVITDTLTPLFVESLDTSTFTPFEASELDDGTYLLTFNDWLEVADALRWSISDVDVEVAEHLAFAILQEDLPEELASGRVTSDSEGESMRLEVATLQALSKVGTTLAKAWSDKPRLQRIARSRAS